MAPKTNKRKNRDEIIRLVDENHGIKCSRKGYSESLSESTLFGYLQSLLLRESTVTVATDLQYDLVPTEVGIDAYNKAPHD